MRLAVVGKGGSGKTTLTSLLIEFAIHQGQTVLGIDADINQTLGAVLGLPENILSTLPSLGSDQNFLKDYVRGDNRLIQTGLHVVKTTPPAEGSGLVSITPDDPVLSHYAYKAPPFYFMQVGGFAQDDIGTHCYHSKTGAVELFLNHLKDGRDEIVIVDMTAGADAFASGLFTRFDLTLLIVEPTLQALSVYQQYKSYASAYGLQIAVVGNKVADQADKDFIRRHVGEDLAGFISLSPAIKARDRGEPLLVEDLEESNRLLLQKIIALLCAQTRDWSRYWDQAISFHLKNAESWANAHTGTDLSRQIQREYLEKWTA